MTSIEVSNLDSIVNQRTFVDGSKRTVSVLASAAVGRGEYLPGWKWSEHAGAQTGKGSEAASFLVPREGFEPTMQFGAAGVRATGLTL